MTKLRVNACLLLALILLLAGALRMFRLTSQSLWGDEACMVYLAQEPASEIVRALASAGRPDVDVAPPVYFLLLHYWFRLFGASDVSARSFSAAAGWLSVLALYLVGRELFDRRTALVGSGLASIHGFWIWYAQEARMYSLALLAALVCTWLFALLLRRPTWPATAAYGLSAVLGLYIQYYFVLLLGVHAVYIAAAAFWPRLSPTGARPQKRMFAAAWAGAAAAFAPWIIVMLRDFRFAQGPGGFPSYFSALATPAFLFLKFASFANEAFLREHMLLYALTALFAAACVAAAFRRPVSWQAMFLGSAIVLPFAVVYSLSLLGLPVYKGHPFIIFSGFFILLTVHGAFRLPRRIGPALVLTLAAANVYTLATLNYSRYYVKPRAAEAVNLLAQALEPGDRIYAVPAVIPCPLTTMGDLLVWKYYAEGRLSITPLAGDQPIDLVNQMDAPSGDRVFAVLLQDNRLSGTANRAILELLGSKYQSRGSWPPLVSGMRDFTLQIHFFSEVAGPPVPVPGLVL